MRVLKRVPNHRAVRSYKEVVFLCSYNWEGFVVVRHVDLLIIRSLRINFDLRDFLRKQNLVTMLLPDLVGIDQPWTDKIKQWFPLKINRFAVHNGEVRYGDFNKEPKVHVVIDRVQMVATNLTNSKKLSETLNADIMIEGRQLAQVMLDPYAPRPTFAILREAARREFLCLARDGATERELLNLCSRAVFC